MQSYTLYNDDVACANFVYANGLIREYRPTMPALLPMQIRSCGAEAFIRYFGNAFKRYRTKHNLSQETFARMLKISCRSYVYIEKCRSLCSVFTFISYWTKYCEEPHAMVKEMRDIFKRQGLTQSPDGDLHIPDFVLNAEQRFSAQDIPDKTSQR